MPQATNDNAARVRLLIAAFVLFVIISPYDAYAQSVTRGPYLQLGTPSSIVIRWRTDVATDSDVRYGTERGNLTSSVSDSTATTEHEIELSGLSEGTTYYYSVGASSQVFAGGDGAHFFSTSPAVGSARPTRVWVLGDSGTADANARAVRDAYLAFTGSVHTDLWLMLGDNAYGEGTDAQYQSAVFDMYPTVLRSSVLWPTLGNHDGISADSATQTGPYYESFTLPTQAEAGGLASGTEAYYSFDYGNVHFICLDSHETDRSRGGAMMMWLEADLSNTAQDWVIAFWHHPPYSKGSHDSDSETRLVQMRENALPIVEAGGVDLVLGGHSHSYERSFLLDGHYGSSGTLTSGMILNGGDGARGGDGPYEKPTAGLAAHDGCVYVVSGSSGKASGGPLNHPAMYISLDLLGSLVLDIDGLELDAQWIDSAGIVRDSFTIVKGDNAPPQAPSDLVATAYSDSEIVLDWTDNASDEDGFQVERSLDGLDWSEVAVVGSEITVYVDPGLAPTTTYYYRARAFNAAGESSYSNTASATTLGDRVVISFATGELSGSGTVDGSFTETRESDDVYEAVSEERSGGKPALRSSLLDHVWTFDIVSGGTVTLLVEAHHTENVEGDDFILAFSTDDIDYSELLTITNTDDENRMQTILLPSSISGTVFIRALDTDRSPGNASVDTLFVDSLMIRTTFGSDTVPPAPPMGLIATAVDSSRIDLDWIDNADGDLALYKVYRKSIQDGFYSLVASGFVASEFADPGLSESTSYAYVVTALDMSGNESLVSNEAVATTRSCAHATTRVASILPTVESLVHGERRGRVEVTIVDECGDPVAGSTVTGRFAGDFAESASALTGTSGVAILTTAPGKGRTSYSFCVDDVAHDFRVYDANANAETCDGSP